jgi:hypothetical protein
MSNELLAQIKAQKYFYRDNYRRSCNVLIVMLGIIFVLIAAIIYFYVSRPSPDFYASGSDGKLIHLTPMSTPNYSHTPLIK